jgi:hypothetical protein
MGTLLNDIEKNTDAKRIPEKGLYRVLDTNGDGTGTIQQATTADKYFIQPPEGVMYVLKRVNIYVEDTNFNSAALYGTITLTNGIKSYVETDDGIIINFTAQQTIKTSYQWGLLAGSDVPVQGGALADPLNIRWTFSKGMGDIILSGNKGERFVMETQDDMSALASQLAMVQGYIL